MSEGTLFWRSKSSSDEEISLNPKQLFGQRFVLLECLGEGGFGQVWRAKDRWLNQEIALKVSLSDLRNETLLLRRLPKDRYVSVFDLVKDESIKAFAYSMEILDSPWKTLERYYDDTLEPDFNKGHFLQALKAILCISIDLLMSLKILHGRKFSKKNRWCHADIKPQNLYVHSKTVSHVVRNSWGDDFAPIVKIGDLGLARESGTRLSMGTEKYMAPEQDGCGNISPATDIFSVGQTVGALISGNPFNDDDLAHINRIRERLQHVIPSAYLVEKIAEVLRKMTRRTPTLRPNADDSMQMLRGILESENDWTILKIFAQYQESGLTLRRAAEELFPEFSTLRNWVNRTSERDTEMKSLIRSAYNRGLLSRTGHQYRIRT